MTTPLNQFLVGVIAPEKFMTFFSTLHADLSKVAESFAGEFWGDFDYPDDMTLLVIDPAIGQHETFQLDCAGYRFDAFVADASDVVKELDLWAVYHQKHLLEKAELISVQIEQQALAWHMGRKIQSVRDPKSPGVPSDLLNKLKEIAGAQETSGGWMCIEDHFFTFVKFQLDQPIPDTREPTVNPD